jgi:hypothetical protein
MIRFDKLPKETLIEGLNSVFGVTQYKDLTLGGDLLFELFRASGVIDSSELCYTRKDLFNYFRRRACIEEFEVQDEG